MLARTAKHVFGIDVDEQAVKHAQNKYIRPNLQFQIGTITEVPVRGERLFDVVVCFEALEHVDDHQKLLSEVKRLLVPDGIFLVSTPNKTLYTDEPHFKNPFHVHELYFDEFKGLLENYFRQVKFLGQRIYCNSSLWPIFPEKRTYPSEFVIERTPEEFTFVEAEKRVPLYFIAVASNSAKDIGGHVSFLVDLSNELVGQRDTAINQATAERDDLKTRMSALAAEKEKLQAATQAQQQLVRLKQEELRQKEAAQARSAQDIAWLQSVVLDKENNLAAKEQDGCGVC